MVDQTKDQAAGFFRTYTPESQLHQYFILSALLLGLILRLLWIFLWQGSITSEGAEYPRLAESLLAGRGYQGIDTPGKNLWFPPLYPLAIAAVTLLTGDAEVSGRVISATLGALLPVPLYCIAHFVYGRSAATVTFFVAAFHPRLAYYATTTLSETTFLTLILSATAFSFVSSRNRSICACIATGAFFGAAYLVKPDALVYMLLACGFIGIRIYLLPGGLSWKRVAACSLAVVAPFVLLASPYVLWLHSQTGQWRIEGKSPFNNAIANRMFLDGFPAEEAHFGVDANLNEFGFALRTNLSVVQDAPRPNLRTITRYLRVRSTEIGGYAVRTFTNHPPFGGALLFGFVILGLFAQPLRRDQILDQLLLAAYCLAGVASLVFIYYYDDRFMLLSFLVTLVWVGNGALHAGNWLNDSIRNILKADFRSHWAGRFSAAGGLVALIPAMAIHTGIYEIKSANDDISLRTAGEWIRNYREGPKRIMATSTVVPFHARGDLVWHPYSNEETALRYLKQKGVDFLVLSDSRHISNPVVTKWLNNGVAPSSDLSKVYETRTRSGRRIVIYEVQHFANSDAKTKLDSRNNE